MDYKEKIDELYRAQNEEGFREASSMSVSFKLQVKTAFMLSAIAENFETNRHNFGGEILDEACREMFISLNEKDAKRLSSEVDLKIKNHLESKDVLVTTHGLGAGIDEGENNGPKDWTMLHYLVHEHGKKKVGDSDE